MAFLSQSREKVGFGTLLSEHLSDRWGISIREIIGAIGPGFLISVGYMDPGNWGTNLAAGAGFGYELLWVILVSNIIAILLQISSAKLGIATGKDLAHLIREQFPRPVVIFLGVTSVIAIMPRIWQKYWVGHLASQYFSIFHFFSRLS
jgi:Mn2+/Fe2+ NRAMP family transporter